MENRALTMYVIILSGYIDNFKVKAREVKGSDL
jgi:hypothetical protein